MIKLSTERTFRQTPGVHFADISIPGSNGVDLVEHSGPSVSPPNGVLGLPQWYVHRHQTDNNRVIKGYRLFELFNPRWEDPHWFVFLSESSGALEIPPGCYHRSYSGLEGSLLLNHAVRDSLYDENKEFFPKYVPWSFLVSPCYHDCDAQSVHHFITTGELL